MLGTAGISSGMKKRQLKASHCSAAVVLPSAGPLQQCLAAGNKPKDVVIHQQALQGTALHCISSHSTALHITALHCTSWHGRACHCTAVQYAAVHFNALYFGARHNMALYCTVLLLLHCTCLNFEIMAAQDTLAHGA